MRNAAILDCPILRSTRLIVGIFAWLLPANAKAADESGAFAAAMPAIDPQDCVLFAEWLRAEDVLAENQAQPAAPHEKCALPELLGLPSSSIRARCS